MILSQSHQDSLHKANTRGKSKSNELLTEFFRSEVTFFIRIPSLEDLLRKVHVVNLLDQAHTCVLMAFYPLFDVLSDKKLLIV